MDELTYDLMKVLGGAILALCGTIAVMARRRNGNVTRHGSGSYDNPVTSFRRATKECKEYTDAEMAKLSSQQRSGLKELKDDLRSLETLLSRIELRIEGHLAYHQGREETRKTTSPFAANDK
jgi:hypothetical protein